MKLWRFKIKPKTVAYIMEGVNIFAFIILFLIMAKYKTSSSDIIDRNVITETYSVCVQSKGVFGVKIDNVAEFSGII